MSQACKYNTREFAPFTSGKKKIKPQPTDDWKVTTGGFKSSTDVLNLTSAKLGQTVYDIGSHSFFKFMKEENVTMNGDEIVGSFAIGTQRVLRKESDYLATMATVNERKSTVIPKKDMILGHRYETVCGSTFVFAGTRYMVKSIHNVNGLKATKMKKYYLSYNGKASYWTPSISDVTAKKVVKDLGKAREEDFLDKEIKAHFDKKGEILFIAKESEKVEYEVIWGQVETTLTNRHNANFTEFIEKDGFIYRKNTEGYGYRFSYDLLEENDGVWALSATKQQIKVDRYEPEKTLGGYKSVIPAWVKK